VRTKLACVTPVLAAGAATIAITVAPAAAADGAEQTCTNSFPTSTKREQYDGATTFGCVTSAGDGPSDTPYDVWSAAAPSHHDGR
jgi:hypothetical protein